MIKRYSILLIALISLVSCKKTREELLCRKWQEVSTENPERDEMVKLQQAFIDTVGNNTTPQQNMEIYGFSNVDSFRRLLQSNMDSFMMLQQREVEQTQFEFKKEGIVYLRTGRRVDSASWKFEEDGVLLLDEQKLKGAGSQLHIEVLTLNDTALRVKFVEGAASAIANFKPVKK